MGVQRTVRVENETVGTPLYLKRKSPLAGLMCLNISPSVSWRLVLSWLPLAGGERGLLVACGATACIRTGWVWGVVVVGWVSVLLVKFTHSLAIPSIRKVGQKSPGNDREEGESHDGPGGIGHDSSGDGFGPLVGQDTEADEPQERPSR